jgi:predicted RNA-binding protein with PIN domain
MGLLIDGYNLLHVAGVFGRGRRGGTLQHSREALLRMLAASIDPVERPRTIVVFDAADAPPGLPREVVHDEMLVRYAANYADADALIEELITADHAPRSLLVVSSDHRIQRAARRRRAKFVDSDVWFAQLVRQRHRNQHRRPKVEKPHGTLDQTQVHYWLAEFEVPATEVPDGPRAPAAEQAKQAPPPPRTDLSADELPLDNPFPPGYGEDLLED